MKHHSFLPIAILLYVAVHLSGCFGNSCAFNCKNGKCVDGDCVCEAGWVGEGCDVEDPCLNADCGNGTCALDAFLNRTCNCDPGWVGQNCKTSLNSWVSGTWTAYDDCSPVSAAYAVTFSPKVGAPAQFEVVGLYQNTSAVVTGEITESGNFSAPKQAFGTTGLDIQIQSTSQVTGNSISIRYVLYNGAIVSSSCSGYMSK